MKTAPIVSAIIVGFVGEILFLKKFHSSLTPSDIMILGISHGLAIVVTIYIRRLSIKEYKAMENKFAIYLEDLDKKNHRLYTQNIKLKVKLKNSQKPQKRV
jgi:hypothetical protein